jgi:hypothetical protein
MKPRESLARAQFAYMHTVRALWPLPLPTSSRWVASPASRGAPGARAEGLQGRQNQSVPDQDGGRRAARAAPHPDVPDAGPLKVDFACQQ